MASFLPSQISLLNHKYPIETDIFRKNLEERRVLINICLDLMAHDAKDDEVEEGGMDMMIVRYDF